MAYSDQQMSGNKMVAIIIVALIHVVIGYLLITGLAFEAAKQVVERVTTVDIEEEEPPEPEEEPPPPEEVPETAPPPPVAPPPPISVATNPPQVRTQTQIPPPAPPAIRIPPSAPVAPPAPPPPPPPPPPPAAPPVAASPRNAAGSWITTNDYRSSWISRGYEGTVSVTLTIGTNGRVSGCTVTGGSAPSELKSASCPLIERRARFNPAERDGQPVTGQYRQTYQWRLDE